MAKFLGPIDDEKSSQGGSIHCIIFFFDKDIVVSAHLFGDISQQWIIDLPKPTILPRCLDPGQMREVRISRHAQNFSSEVLELLDVVAEGDELRWTDVGKIERIEY